MSHDSDPFDSRTNLHICSCGKHVDQTEHDADKTAPTGEALHRPTLEAAAIRALFARDSIRRRFLQAVGAGSAYAALTSLMPFGALEALAQEKAPLEKKDLKVGFVPITCSTPLIMAGPMGFYEKHGLN